jgi:brefeldin A-resistance guanine nucleotide exchange factor 1
VAEYEEEDDVEDMISDPLLKSLIRLKGKLRKDKLVVTDPNYLRPFCEVIKNKDVSGPVTGLALQSILKFINYGLIKNESAVQMISDSVTKARFIGTDTSSDEVVLMRILNVLRELIVRRYKSLTNGAVCEIMQSCFRIAFEPRLSELLRKSAEQSLVDMVQVLFRRIPEFNHEFVDELCFIKMGPKLNTSLSKRSKHNINNTKADFINKQSIKFNKEENSGSGIY